MAKAQETERVGFVGRMKQLGMVFRFTAKRDKLFLPLVALAVTIALGLTVLMWLFWSWIFIPVGLMLVPLAVLIVLNLRANRAMMSEAEGQPGAAASIVENMRGDFRVTPALASTTQMDFVHLVICRGGVVLLGEGNPARVRGLIAQERKRLARLAKATVAPRLRIALETAAEAEADEAALAEALAEVEQEREEIEA